MSTDDSGLTTVITVNDESQIAEARRHVASLTRSMACDEAGHGRIAIITTELATNIIRHGHGGELLCRILGNGSGIELIACDHGPGMANIQECMRDGFSTNGTSGNGLGAVRRLSVVFDMYSAPGKGTVLVAQVAAPGPAHLPRMSIGAVCIPLAGESACGDNWRIQESSGGIRIVVADGLGHGVDAAHASLGAMRVVEETAKSSPRAVIETAHRAIGGSRGAAMAVCDIQVALGQTTFCGIGNISGIVVTPEGQRNMMSHNGIVGHNQRKIQEFTYPWMDNAILIMHSDGLQTRWSLDEYPGLRNCHPSVIAAVLRRDFSRDRDDLCIVVVKVAQ
jgi:anti-sigma regulatory factor (Ser/Thr protein kinase)